MAKTVYLNLTEITTHELLYSMQQNIKLRTIYNINHINRNNTIVLGRNPQTKPKMGKSVQQYEMIFLLRKYGAFTNQKF